MRQRSFPLLLTGLWAVSFLFSLKTPDNLIELGQEMHLGYIQDVVLRGEWILPRDLDGKISSKPPLAVWIGALVCMPFERTPMVAANFSVALGTLGLLLLIYFSGRRVFGEHPARIAALIYLFSFFAYKTQTLLRSDSWFAFFVYFSLILADRALRGRGSWAAFWLVSALATLCKGPLGLLLVLGGVSVCFFWMRRLPDWKGFLRGLWPGLLIYLVLVCGWFLLALREGGEEAGRKYLVDELLGHAVTGKKGDYPGMRLYDSPIFFFGRFFPWSLASVAALVALWRRPAEAPDARYGERLHAGYFLFGLALFSLAPNQRDYYLLPLMPSAALLTGRWLAQWRERRFPRLAWNHALLLVAAGYFTVFGVYIYLYRPKHPATLETRACREMAARLNAIFPSGGAITFLDSPAALRYYMNTMRRNAWGAASSEAMRTSLPAYVVVKKQRRLWEAWPEDAPPPRLLMEIQGGDNFFLRVYGNRPELRMRPEGYFLTDSIRARFSGMFCLGEPILNHMVFEMREPDHPALWLNNLRDTPARLTLELRENGRRWTRAIELGPNEEKAFDTAALRALP